MLFSAGYPLGGRQLGIDVPRTFKHLDVGPIFNTQPRLPGHLSTNSVRETRARFPPSLSPVPYVRFAVFVLSAVPNVCFRMLGPGSSISFRLAENQGAILVTKYLTYREDIQRAGKFEKYTKDHYDSWVAFARDTEHGNDIKPVLVTGVDMTRDFAMLSYSNDGDNMTSEFITSAPGVSSSWGTWRSTGSVYTNCGPHLLRPSSATQAMDLAPPDAGHAETTPDEYNQCVFVRYYTVRKRLGIPKVIKAAAGPHDLGPGSRNTEDSPLEERFDSDPDSDIASGLFDDDKDDKSSVTSVGSDISSDTIIHNTTSVRSFPCHPVFFLV